MADSTNLPDSNNVFFNNVLTNPNLYIPLEANFAVRFNNFDLILINLDYDETLYQYSDESFLNAPSVSKNFSDGVDPSSGEIFFANGVKIPGEGSDFGRVGMYTAASNVAGGLLSSPILKGRKNLTNLEISFLETNTSFIDFIMRRWIIAASQYGLFARSAASAQNFKTDITITFLDKNTQNPYGSGSQLAARKVLTFHDAVPVDISSYDAAYGNTKTNMRTTAVQWIYSTYDVNPS